jgi:uncharacterized protein (TIRG00374 family)
LRLRAAQAAIALALVAAVVLRSQPRELWRTLQAVDPEFCLVALGLNVPVLLLASLRSYLVIRGMGYGIQRDVLIPSTILGFVAGGLTPAASGELLRTQALRTRAGIPLQPGLTAVIYERSMSLYLLLLSTGLILVLGVLSGAWRGLAVAGALVLCLLPWAVAVWFGRLLPAEDRVRAEGFVAAALRRALSLSAHLRTLLVDGRLLVAFSAVSTAIFGLIAVQYWFLARAAGTSVGVGDAWLVFGISTFAGVAALIPLGLGVLDASLAAALDRLGTTLEEGGVVALLVRGIVTLPLVVAAFGSYLYLQRSESRNLSRPTGPPAIKDHAVE